MAEPGRMQDPQPVLKARTKITGHQLPGRFFMREIIMGGSCYGPASELPLRSGS